jgi:hypothetical protein
LTLRFYPGHTKPLQELVDEIGSESMLQDETRIYVFPTKGWEVVMPPNPEMSWSDKRKKLLFSVKRGRNGIWRGQQEKARLVSLSGKLGYTYDCVSRKWTEMLIEECEVRVG